MKKFIFCAAAAIVALASCSKTQVVYNGAPEEISFKAVTGAVTKAEQTGTLSGNMGVFAFVNDTKAPYFANVEFTGTTTWTGGQYWPLQSNLDFVVYAPHGNASYETNTLSVTGADNTGKTTIGAQTDYLYGAEYYDDTDNKGYSKETVGTALKHALAKVTLAFTGSNVTVNSVSLVKPTLKGSYTVAYSAATPVAAWTATAEATNLTLTEFADKTLDNSAQSVSIMVVPADDSDIAITYTIAGTDDVLNATIPLTSTWAPGTHYTYNISINPNAIEFSAPAVTGWTENDPDPSGTTIQ